MVIESEESVKVLNELADNIKVFQVNQRLLNESLRTGKYKDSYEELKEKIQKGFVSFCGIYMMRKAKNVEEYCSFIQISFDKRNRRFSKACRYLKGKMLKDELVKIRDEILDEEYEYCLKNFEPKQGKTIYIAEDENAEQTVSRAG